MSSDSNKKKLAFYDKFLPYKERYISLSDKINTNERLELFKARLFTSTLLLITFIMIIIHIHNYISKSPPSKTSAKETPTCIICLCTTLIVQRYFLYTYRITAYIFFIIYHLYLPFLVKFNTIEDKLCGSPDKAIVLVFGLILDSKSAFLSFFILIGRNIQLIYGYNFENWGETSQFIVHGYFADMTFLMILSCYVLPKFQELLLHDSLKAAKELEEIIEKKNQLSKLKQNFIGRVSHEMRTPLTCLLGVLDILRNSKLNYQQYISHTENAYKSCTMLLQLVNNILLHLRSGTSSSILNNADFIFRNMLNEVIDMIRYESDKREINFLYSVSPCILHTINGDFVSQKQIILNLLYNALKFTDNNGRVELDVEYIGKINNNNNCTINNCKECTCIEIRVNDNGKGIKFDMLDIIFEPFVTSGGSNDTSTGLGLPLVKRLCELMNGGVKVESIVNVGTTFTCRISIHSSSDKNINEHNNNEIVLCVDGSAPTSISLSKKMSIMKDFNQLNYFMSRLGLLKSNDNDIIVHPLKSVENLLFDCNILIGDCSCSCSYSNICEFEQLQNSIMDKSRVHFFKLYDNVPICCANLVKTQMVNNESKLVNNINFNTENRQFLVVEDNEYNLKTIIAMLKFIGISSNNIHGFVNCKLGVDFVKTCNFSDLVVILDLNTPIMNGDEAADKIREWNHNNPHINIFLVLLTANAIVNDKIKAKFDAYLVKPLKIPTLKNLLQE